jgi:hypothetical protein
VTQSPVDTGKLLFKFSVIHIYVEKHQYQCLRVNGQLYNACYNAQISIIKQLSFPHNRDLRFLEEDQKYGYIVGFQ